MNLMDMLGQDAHNGNGLPPQGYINGAYFGVPPNPQAYQIDRTPGRHRLLNTHTNELAVFHLPTVLSPVQQEMSEAVVQIFKSNIVAELGSSQLRTSINNLLSSDSNGAAELENASAKLASFIYSQLLTICMHPSLVIDHFISKGLLLLSTKERLSILSGKTMLFNKLTDLLCAHYELSQPAADYHMLVVANSSKELELIEGLVVGKNLVYRNLSNGKRLYEETEKASQIHEEESVDEEQLQSFRKRARKSLQNAKNLSSSLNLHLITSSHLTQSFSLAVKFNLIFSFDAGLDTLSGAVEVLRMQAASDFENWGMEPSRVPVLIPIPLYLVEHLALIYPAPDVQIGQLAKSADQARKTQIVQSFVVNRHKIHDLMAIDFFVKSYGKGFEKLRPWLFDWKANGSPACLNLLSEYSAEVARLWSNDEFKDSLSANLLDDDPTAYSVEQLPGYSVGIDPAFSNSLDFHNFKLHLARFLHGRLARMETIMDSAYSKVLPQAREFEARRQVEIDEDEDKVGAMYRALRKLNEDAAQFDRKLNRVEGENQKLHDLVNGVEEVSEYMWKVAKDENIEGLENMLQEQTAAKTALEQEAASLKVEVEKLKTESEAVRAEYQAKSTEAVQQTEKLAVIKAKHIGILRKIEGPGSQLLPSLARKDELALYELKLARLDQENKFIADLFATRFDKLLKERQILSDSTSSGSSSRPTNRVSRASTPF